MKHILLLFHELLNKLGVDEVITNWRYTIDMTITNFMKHTHSKLEGLLILLECK